MEGKRVSSLIGISLLAVTTFSHPNARAQENENPKPNNTGKASIDTTAVTSDSSYVSIIPISLIGSIDRKLPADKFITDTAATWNDYGHLNDIIAVRPGAFVRDLGSVGQYSELTLGGVDGRSIAFLQDGIMINEPLTGLYNSFWYQTEQIDRVEIERGTRAFLYGYNSTGGVINMISKSYKAIRPHSRIRYSESRYEQTHFDGMFSQNITRTINLTGSLQRFVTDGRFRNSNYDAWSGRFKARYNLSNRVNLFFSENYTQTQLGLFGGINYNTTNPVFLFDRLQAQIVSEDSYEKITRHDLQLGAAALFFSDTSDVTTITAYYSTHLREFRNEDNRQNPDTLFIQDDHHARWQGVKLTQRVNIEGQALDVGAEAQSRQVIESPATGDRRQIASSVYGKLELQPFERVRLAGYARIDNAFGRTPVSYGGDAALTPFRGLTLFAGYSRSSRFPTFQELYWRLRNVRGPSTEFGQEEHQLVETGLRLQAGNVFTLQSRYFLRTVRNAINIFRAGTAEPFPGIEFIAQEKIEYRGIEAEATLRFWHIYADGVAGYLVVKEFGVVQLPPVNGAANRFPEWRASGGLYYWNTLFDNNLDLKIGFRGRVIGPQRGTEFNPEAMMFVPSSLPDVGIATAVDGILLAHIGSAYVHFIWQNLFDNNYVVTPFYPMPDRAVRFGITWELLD